MELNYKTLCNYYIYIILLLCFDNEDIKFDKP